MICPMCYKANIKLNINNEYVCPFCNHIFRVGRVA